MNRGIEDYSLEFTIHPHGNFDSRPFWVPPTESTYYDYRLDSQCGVPIKSLEELRKELELIDF